MPSCSCASSVARHSSASDTPGMAVRPECLRYSKSSAGCWFGRKTLPLRLLRSAALDLERFDLDLAVGDARWTWPSGTITAESSGIATGGGGGGGASASKLSSAHSLWSERSW
eukprot:scaffold62224_cov65-Phaeocystis_antarctica.AAC.3